MTRMDTAPLERSDSIALELDEGERVGMSERPCVGLAQGQGWRKHRSFLFFCGADKVPPPRWTMGRRCSGPFPRCSGAGTMSSLRVAMPEIAPRSPSGDDDVIAYGA